MRHQQKYLRNTRTVTHPQLLSVHKVCERFAVSQRYVYRHAKELPHYRLGSRMKFSEAELLRYWK